MPDATSDSIQPHCLATRHTSTKRRHALVRAVKMVGKKSGRALLREEGMYTALPFPKLGDERCKHGIFAKSLRCIFPLTARHQACVHAANRACAGLQRTDNNMEFTTWPQVNMINQKNYYTCVSFSSPPHPCLLPFRYGWEKRARWLAQGQEKCLRSECAIREEVLTLHHFTFASSANASYSRSEPVPGCLLTIALQ